VLPGGALSLKLATELGALEPCGKGNPAARVVVEGAVDRVRIDVIKCPGSLGGIRIGGRPV